MKKYYTIFITEESDYHCERIVATYKAEPNLKPKDVFDLFLNERDKTNTSFVVEGITSSDSPVEFLSFDELVCDPSNRLAEKGYKPMSKPIFTGCEIGYEEESALDYFHDSTDGRYLDDNKFKVVAHRYKDITDEDDKAQGLTDWEWTIDVYPKP